jgi:hypothetical protein
MITTAPAALQRYGITSPLLVAHVLARGGLECRSGHKAVENFHARPSRWSRHGTAASATGREILTSSFSPASAATASCGLFDCALNQVAAFVMLGNGV